jgi:hypothetical protein
VLASKPKGVLFEKKDVSRELFHSDNIWVLAGVFVSADLIGERFVLCLSHRDFDELQTTIYAPFISLSFQ